MDNIKSDPYLTLLSQLLTAEAGGPYLSTLVFLALGGVIRTEPISKQGGELVEFPYWPGEADPCASIAFTTNLSDIGHFFIRKGWRWQLHSNHTKNVCTIFIGSPQRPVKGRGRTTCLAMCSAAVRIASNTK